MRSLHVLRTHLVSVAYATSLLSGGALVAMLFSEAAPAAGLYASSPAQPGRAAP